MILEKYLLKSEVRKNFHLTFKKKHKISTGEIYFRNSNKFNPAFDVTPARYITKLITENGLIEPTKSEIMKNLQK